MSEKKPYFEKIAFRSLLVFIFESVIGQMFAGMTYILSDQCRSYWVEKINRERSDAKDEHHS